MARRKICRLLISFSLGLIHLLCSVALTHGQVECIPNIQGQCDTNYYCDDDFKCKKCALCENFEPSNTTLPCPKSPEQCGVCLVGFMPIIQLHVKHRQNITKYEFHSPGKCVEQYTLKIFFFWVGAASSTIILIAMVVAAVICFIRKKNKRTRYCPEDAIGSSNVVLLPAPQPPSAPPPPYPTLQQPPFNPHYNGLSEPILKHSPCAQEIEMDNQQMANPYTNCVRLPHDINSYNLERSMEVPYENDDLNGDVDLEANVDDAADDAHNNNHLPAAPPPLSRSTSERRVVMFTAVAEAESLLNTTSLSDTSERVQESHTEVGNIDRDHESAGAGAPAADDASGGGSQQLIVQFINNISPILNLQGNNTRR